MWFILIFAGDMLSIIIVKRGLSQAVAVSIKMSAAIIGESLLQ